ncbi:MAG: DUF4058 family protein [Nostoc sp.]
MAYPFPGMNPYLEDPELWPGVHGRLIVAIADYLSPQLRLKYFVVSQANMVWADALLQKKGLR